MNKKPHFFCTLALLLALAAGIFTLVHMTNTTTLLRANLEENEDALASSQSAWQETAKEKEKLLDEKNDYLKRIKEADLSISESREKCDTLEKQIAELKVEKDTLQREILALTEE